MRIWRLAHPRGFRSESYPFGCLVVSYDLKPLPGTWGDPSTPWSKVANRYGVCSKCGSAPPEEQVPGVTIEWLLDTRELGDFCWDEGDSRPLVKERVMHDLSCFSELEFYAARVVRGKITARDAKDYKGRKRWRYEGPQLYQLWPTRVVPIDTQRSSIRVDLCSRCGRQRWMVEGVEWHSSRYDRERRCLVPVCTPRVPGRGLFVHGRDLGEADIFRLQREVVPSGWFCTDRFKEFVEQQAYAAAPDFWEFGNVV